MIFFYYGPIQLKIKYNFNFRFCIKFHGILRFTFWLVTGSPEKVQENKAETVSFCRSDSWLQHVSY